MGVCWGVLIAGFEYIEERGVHGLMILLSSVVASDDFFPRAYPK